MLISVGRRESYRLVLVTKYRFLYPVNSGFSRSDATGEKPLRETV